MADALPPEDDADADLVLAMPRRELFALSGFSTRISYQVLESLADESWFAARSTLIGSLEAKEVRAGLVFVRPGGSDEVLLGDGGTLVHATSIPPAVARFGSGLRGLREFAVAAGSRFLGSSCRVELVGHLNDDALAETRGILLLVYRAMVPAETAAPAGCAWRAVANLRHEALDPVGTVVAAGLFPG